MVRLIISAANKSLHPRRTTQHGRKQTRERLLNISVGKNAHPCSPCTVCLEEIRALKEAAYLNTRYATFVFSSGTA